MLVTADVSHSPIGPYVVVAVTGFVIQAATAVAKLVFVMAVVLLVHVPDQEGYAAWRVPPHLL